MKKIKEILKPFFCIVFGALLLLCYFNNLNMNGGALAVGIIALVLAVYYITIGIITFTLGVRMGYTTRKVFDTISICAFPVFMFVVFLINLINNNKAFVGPTGWVVAILSMIAAIGAAIMLMVVALVNNRGVKKAGQLVGMVFLLALVLDIVFVRENGTPQTLGGIVVISFFVYFLYGEMLFESFVEKPRPAPAPRPVAPTPAPAPEVTAEPAPAPHVEAEPVEEIAPEAPQE